MLLIAGHGGCTWIALHLMASLFPN